MTRGSDLETLLNFFRMIPSTKLTEPRNVSESVDVFSFWVFLKIDILKEDFWMWEMRKQFSTLDLCFRV